VFASIHGDWMVIDWLWSCSESCVVKARFELLLWVRPSDKSNRKAYLNYLRTYIQSVQSMKTGKNSLY